MKPPLFALALVASLQASLPPPFPRAGATKVFENERVAIWDVQWPPGSRTPTHRHPYPIVGITLAPGKTRAIQADGMARVNDLGPVGAVLYAPARITHAEEAASSPSPRAILIELNDTRPGTFVPKPDMPPEFGASTPGATKVLENDRVIVYDFAFDVKTPVPPHYHVRDSVVVTVAPGQIRATPLSGDAQVTTLAFGDAVFRPRDRAHREEVAEGAPRNIIVELK